MRKILPIISILFLFSCGNKPNKNNSDCKNLYADEKIELCLPAEWKSKKAGKYILFENNSKDSIPFNKSVIAVMVDDYKKEFRAEIIRDNHLSSMLESKTLNAKEISKGSQKINGKTFYDFEVNTKNGEIYSYFLFYHKENYGYSISLSIGEKIRKGIGKKEYLSFLKSLKIK